MFVFVVITWARLDLQGVKVCAYKKKVFVFVYCNNMGKTRSTRRQGMRLQKKVSVFVYCNNMGKTRFTKRQGMRLQKKRCSYSSIVITWARLDLQGVKVCAYKKRCPYSSIIITWARLDLQGVKVCAYKKKVSVFVYYNNMGKTVCEASCPVFNSKDIM